MTNTVQHKRTSVAGNAPTAGQIAVGELAINLADRKIYTKDGSNAIVQLCANDFGVNTGTGGRDYQIEPVAPTVRSASAGGTPLVEGDLWFDNSNNLLFVRTAVDWVLVGSRSQLSTFNNFASQATSFGRACDMEFDASGNLYWAVSNQRSGSNYLLTSYVYKVDAFGTLTAFASEPTLGAFGTALAFAADGNLYWAIVNYYDGVPPGHGLTSYIYKIDPSGTKTLFASQATVGAVGTDLKFDAAGNLYWAITNNITNAGSTLQTSYVYKIDPSGVLTTFASQATEGGSGTALKFDTAGNLYWAVANERNATNRLRTSYVYKIDPGGVKTTFASVATSGAIDVALEFDAAGNLFWAVANEFNGTSRNLFSYVYKIDQAGVMTTLATAATNGPRGVDLAFDSQGVLYWAVGNYLNGATNILTSYVYKIDAAGNLSTFYSQASIGATQTKLKFDRAGNLYWALLNASDGTTTEQNSYIYKASI